MIILSVLNILVVVQLIDAGADFDRPMKDGRTAIMLTAEKGQDRILEILIEAGADIFAFTKGGDGGKTAAMLAKQFRMDGVTAEACTRDADGNDCPFTPGDGKSCAKIEGCSYTRPTKDLLAVLTEAGADVDADFVNAGHNMPPLEKSDRRDEL